MTKKIGTAEDVKGPERNLSNNKDRSDCPACEKGGWAWISTTPTAAKNDTVVSLLLNSGEMDERCVPDGFPVGTDDAERASAS